MAGTAGPRPIAAGAFDLLHPLASGGMGEVWYGRHRSLGLPVAVKILAGDYRYNETALNAFTSEVRAVAGLTHPGIVTVLDYGTLTEEGLHGVRTSILVGNPYLVMELAEGTLEGRYDEMRWAETKAMLTSVLEALAHAHARGVIHRDIKPPNVLRFTDDTWKLADFGIAHAAGTHDSMICGTPLYMAPEQFSGSWRDFGPWTDLYSTACFTWELVTGEPLFSGGIMQLLEAHHVTEPGEFKPRFAVPEQLENWLHINLSKRPSERNASAADALFVLGGMEEVDDTASDRAPPKPERDATTYRFHVDWPSSVAKPIARRGSSRTERIPMPANWRNQHSHAGNPGLAAAGIGLYGLRVLRMVDRNLERDELWSTLGQVHTSGRLRTVLIRGAAGTGKSRLASWLVERAHEVGAARHLVAVHGDPAGPHDGLAEMVADHLRCRNLDRTDIARRVGSFPDLVELIQPAGNEDTALKTRRDRWRVVGRFLSRVAADRPAILWLDDIQWGDELVGFVDYLREFHADDALLVVMTARDEALLSMRELERSLDGLMAHHDSTELRILPLEGPDRTELVQEMLGLREGLAHEVEERTAGNPLFAVQLVGDWVQRGLLTLGDDGFRLRAGADARIPDAIHELWLSRIGAFFDHCTDEERRGVEVAAVLGHRVDVGEWAEVCRQLGFESPLALPERMESQQLATRIDHGWAFAHRLLVESILRLLSETPRMETYRSACAGFLFESGISHQRSGRHHEARTQLGRALALGGAGDDGFRGRILSALGISLFNVGMLLQAHEALSGSLPLLTEPQALAEARIQLGFVSRDLGRNPQSIAHFRASLELNEQLRDPTIHGDALTGIAYNHLDLGEWDQAETVAAAGIAAAAAQGETRTEANGLNSLGQTLFALGRWEESAAAYERARDLFRSLGLSRSVAMALHNLSNLKRRVGETAAAAALMEEAIALHRETGNRASLANSLGSLANVRTATGDYQAAIALYLESAEMHRSMARLLPVAVQMINLCELYAEQGRFQLSQEAIDEATALVGNHKQLSAMSICQQGILYAHMGRDEAAETLQDALQKFRDAGDVVTSGSILTELGILEMADDPSAARALLEEALAIEPFAVTMDALRARAARAELDHAWDDLRAVEAAYSTAGNRYSQAELECRKSRMYLIDLDTNSATEAVAKVERLAADMGLCPQSRLLRAATLLREQLSGRA